MADPVFTLSALDHWTHAGTALAVLGRPIRHSLSPAMHNAALAAMAAIDPRFADWRYFRFEVDPADLPAALHRLHALGFRGLNLTVPHKVLAVTQVTDVAPAARATGAVNTLQWTADGWQGSNTDGHGLAAGIREDLGLSLTGRPVILLGAGGAARAAAVECLRQRCSALWIGNRTAERRNGLLAALQPMANGVPVHGFAPDHVPSGIPAGAVVINATSVGLRDTDPAPVELHALARPAAVYDMVYNPPLTALLRSADALGLPNANGLSMLVHQGAKALATWTGSSVPVDVMRRAAVTALTA